MECFDASDDKEPDFVEMPFGALEDPIRYYLSQTSTVENNIYYVNNSVFYIKYSSSQIFFIKGRNFREKVVKFPRKIPILRFCLVVIPYKKC